MIVVVLTSPKKEMSFYILRGMTYKFAEPSFSYFLMSNSLMRHFFSPKFLMHG